MRNIYLVLVPALALAATLRVHAQSVTLGIGANLVAVPAGSTVSNAAALAELYGSPFVARTVIGQNGRTHFDPYIPGLTTPFAINPNEPRGYVVMGGARRAAPIPVFILMDGSRLRYYSDTGEEIGDVSIQIAPSHTPVATDGKSLFAVEKIMDTFIIHRYSVNNSERTTLKTFFNVPPSAVIADFRVQSDGSLTFKSRESFEQPSYGRITPDGKLNFLFQEPTSRVFSDIRAPITQGRFLYLLRQFTDSTEPIDGIYYHNPQIWTVDLTTPYGSLLRLTNEPLGIHWFDVSWDGKWVVYNVTTGIPTNIWIKDTGGARSAEPIVTHLSHDYLPRFFPDSQRILFHSNREVEGGLYTMNLENIQDVRRFGAVARSSYNPSDRFVLLTREELP